MGQTVPVPCTCEKQEQPEAEDVSTQSPNKEPKNKSPTGETRLVTLVQNEGYPTVRIFEHPKIGARVVGEIPSHSEVDCFTDKVHTVKSFFKVKWGDVEGWVGVKNVRSKPSVLSPVERFDSLDTASTSRSTTSSSEDAECDVKKDGAEADATVEQAKKNMYTPREPAKGERAPEEPKQRKSDPEQKATGHYDERKNTSEQKLSSHSDERQNQGSSKSQRTSKSHPVILRGSRPSRTPRTLRDLAQVERSDSRPTRKHSAVHQEFVARAEELLKSSTVDSSAGVDLDAEISRRTTADTGAGVGDMSTGMQKMPSGPKRRQSDPVVRTAERSDERKKSSSSEPTKTGRSKEAKKASSSEKQKSRVTPRTSGPASAAACRELEELRPGGRSQELKRECTADEVKEAGLEMFKEAGYTIWDVKDAAFDAGFKYEQFKQAGYHFRWLRMAYSVQQLREMGCVAWKLREEGFSCEDLKEAGYPPADMKTAGYSAEEVKRAGYSCAEMKKGGFTNAELIRAEHKSHEMKEADPHHEIEELKEAGCSVFELKQAGYRLQDLREAGYTAKELREGMFTAKELKMEGYSVMELKEAGYTLTEKFHCCEDEELRHAGYSHTQLLAESALLFRSKEKRRQADKERKTPRMAGA